MSVPVIEIVAMAQANLADLAMPRPDEKAAQRLMSRSALLAYQATRAVLADSGWQPADLAAAGLFMGVGASGSDVGQLQRILVASFVDGHFAATQFGDRGLTVMDGPFGSIMPYGLSGLLSLSSVAYTHHKISYEDLPQFDCQIPEDTTCRPEAPGICTDCPRRPVSNANKMLAQMRQYFSESVQFEYFFSYFTIKSKLKSSYIDDGRPTEISMLRDTPRFYCLFSGKINSIYEVEKIV